MNRWVIGRWTGGLGFLLALLWAAGCGSGPTVVVTHMLSGTFTSTTIDASGRHVFLRLMAKNDPIDGTALYLAREVFSGPSCSYEIPFVDEGEYSAYAFIDFNSNASEADPLPDAADVTASPRLLVLMSSQRLDYDDSSWRLQP